MFNKLTVTVCFLFLVKYSLGQRSDIYLYHSERVDSSGTAFLTASPMYLYVDSNGRTCQVDRGFCSTVDFHYVKDTIEINGEVEINSRKVIDPHPVTRIYKLEKRSAGYDLLMLDTTNDKWIRQPYFTFNKSVSALTKGLYFLKDKYHSDYTVQLESDTTIIFNQRRISCYKVVETLKGSTGEFKVLSYLDKSEMIPVLLEFKSVRTLQSVQFPTISIRRFYLYGKMEIDEKLINRRDLLLLNRNN
jgi:hypothetical protein